MRKLKCYLIVGCILMAAQFATAANPQWVEVRSPNFSVITDAGEKKGREVALHFEQMRSVFGTLMTRAKVNLPVPLQIVAFRNSKEIRQVAPIFNGKATEVGGLFQGGEDRCFIMLDMSLEDRWTAVFHEYAHRLLDGNISSRPDPWFEEGFAEYFASIEVDSKEARVGKIPEQTYQILQQMGMTKISDLFRVQLNSKTYNESGDHRTTFYAESALVVHYLYDNQLIPRLAVYFDTLQVQKKPVEQAIQAAFGMTGEQFDKTLQSYLRSGRYRYYPIATPAGIVAAQFTVTPVSVADAQAVVADVHAHSPFYQDRALAEFQDVLKMDPENTAALRGAGFASLQQKDYERAAEYLRRAAQHDSKDARVHYYYAMLLNQKGPPDTARSAEIKKELEATISLDPNLADAYALLGFTQAFSGEPEKAIATMKKALELSPRNEHYMFNLASVCLANHRFDDAIAIYQNLARSADPEIALRASQSLEQAIDFQEQMASVELHAGTESGQIPEVQLHIRSEKGESPEKQRAGPEDVMAQAPVAPAPVHFIKGKLVAVDCSGAPQALLTVTSGTKSIKVHIRDSAHVVLIGADEFSCDWKEKRVAVNYRERPDGEGDAVSIEMQ